MATTTNLVIATCLVAPTLGATVRAAFTGAPQPNDFGSGAFGTWIQDEVGGPVYDYTLDQTTDPRATYNSTVDPFFRLPTDHLFHIGNDRIVALTSNYGYISIRSDEGGPKILNDFYPEGGAQFGGGIGYLTASTPSGAGLVLSSFYNHTGQCGVSTSGSSCGNHSFDRRFGVGYLEKRVAGCSTDAGSAAAEVGHTLVVPYGSDPVVVFNGFDHQHWGRPSRLHVDGGLVRGLVSLGHLIEGARVQRHCRQPRPEQEWGRRNTPSARTRQRRSPPTSPISGPLRRATTHPPLHARMRSGAAGSPGVQAGFSYDGLSRADQAELARVQAALAQAAAHNAFVGPMQSSLPPGRLPLGRGPPEHRPA